MRLKAIQLIALDDYKLIIKYDTGEAKFIDLKDEIFKYDCWKELRDEDVFKKAFIDEFDDAPCWSDNLDMDPVEIYYMGVLMSEEEVMFQRRLEMAKRIMEENKSLFERLSKL